MAKSPRVNWTREEHILAFELYNRTTFGKIHMGNPEIIKLAQLLGRSVGAVSYKLANFARLDPALQARDIRGMPHGAKGEAEVWQEFRADPEGLAYECECLRAKRLGKPVEVVAEIRTDDLPAGLEREAIVRVRVNQSFFRQRILSAFNFRCCVTGLSVKPLLMASHIVPWAEDKKNRLNPRNGLCLNALHDKAFDRHLMWIDGSYKVRFARELHEAFRSGEQSLRTLLQTEGASLLLQPNFTPEPEFLRIHAERCNVKPSQR